MNKGFTVWFTGLSASGKSTLAQLLGARLRERGVSVEILDGDVVRTNLSKGLGFSKEDRDTNIRRIGFVCSLLTRNGAVAIAAAISPYRAIRDENRALIGDFVEVFADCPVEECARRDPKGLYAKAFAGEIKEFTGVSDPYEPPPSPEVHCRTDRETPEQSVGKIVAKLEELAFVPPFAPSPIPGPIPPHGGVLVDCLVHDPEEREALQRVDLPELPVGPVTVSDLEMIAVGAFSPLQGFLGQEDYESVLETGRLNGRGQGAGDRGQGRTLAGGAGLRAGRTAPREVSGPHWPAPGRMGPRTSPIRPLHGNSPAWTIPIMLSATKEQASGLTSGQQVALVAETGERVALLDLEEVFSYDPRREALAVFQTEDEAHPGVARVYRQGELYLSGPIRLIRGQDGMNGEESGACRSLSPVTCTLSPAELRSLFDERGWKTVVAFQTRNPIHRAHEYLQKCALEMVDALAVHPIVGDTKEDDISAEVRLRCYTALLEQYYPPDRVVLSLLPTAMRYAGPKEAIHHAIMRQNFGCTHIIIGRDHAGVGDYYGTFDAHDIFDEYPDLLITPLKFDHAFYCRVCGGMATAKTCPHDGEDHLFLSGTKVREMLQAGEDLPAEFTRPEVAGVLQGGM